MPGWGIFGTKRHVKPIFVGSYGNDFTRGIYVFHIDIDNGELLKKKYYKSPANPVAFYKRERFIYVCYLNNTGRATDGGLWQYANMDLQFGLASRVYNQGKTFIDSFVNEDRTYAYAVDYYNSEVVVMPILKQKIVKVTQIIKHEGKGLDERKQTQAHPCFIEETPDHQNIFVCDLGTDEVVLYDLIENGQLQRNDEKTIHLTPGSGPKKMIFDASGKFAYILNELSSTVCVYAYENGHFTFLQEFDTYPKDKYNDDNLAGDIVYSKQEDKDILFVSNRGHDSVSVFELDKKTGLATYVEFLDTDQNPRSMILVLNRWLVVASQKGGTLETFEIRMNEGKGFLFETHFSYSVSEPVCLIEGRGI